MNEQEQTSLMIEKSDDELIKYAEDFCTCVEGRPVIKELARRYKKLLMELEEKVISRS